MTVARSLASLLALFWLSWLLLVSAPVRADAPACTPASFAPPASAAELELVPDCFLDLRGNALRSERAYGLLHAPTKAHHLIALAEDVLFLAVGTTWYWIADEKNLVDWDRPSAKARFTADVIRFDNNEFPINFTLHPWSGAAYYSAARTNGASIAWSSVYALGATLAWEYGIEFREKVSLNDLIFTPLPGITLGEFFSRLALYVNRFPGKPTLAQRFASVLFGPLQAFSDAVTKTNKQVETAADALGYSAAIHHRFRLYAGLALQNAGSEEGLLFDFGADGAFVNVPSHLRPGRFRKLLYDGDFTRFWLTYAHGPAGREFDSYADLSLLGLYTQRITHDARGGFFFFGTTLGYRYRRSLFQGFHDEVAATHLPGVGMETALLFGPRAWLRISYRLHPDFAGVHTFGYPAWQAANPDAQGKTVTAKWGYWYGFGVTSLLEASLTWSPATLGGRTWFAAYNSTEGLDRSQEELTADPRATDQLLDAESYLRFTLGRSGLELELALLVRRHHSRYGGYEAGGKLLRSSVRLGATF